MATPGDGARSGTGGPEPNSTLETQWLSLKETDSSVLRLEKRVLIETLHRSGNCVSPCVLPLKDESFHH